MRIQIAVSLILALAMPALADQITLKNGDRITGAIVKADGKQLVLKTDYAGDVTVKLDAIQNITSTGDLHVGLKDGKTLVGPVTTSGDQVKPQPSFGWPPPIGLTSAAVSTGKFFRQCSLPVTVSTQIKSPWPPRAYSSSPSTVGVALGPAFQLFPFHVNTGPIFADQSSSTLLP